MSSDENNSTDNEIELKIDFQVAEKLYKVFQSVRTIKDINIISSDESEGIIMFSYIFSETKFKAEIHLTALFSMIRIINAFDFSATDTLKESDLKNKANIFNLSAIGLKAVVMNEDTKLVHFCAERVFFGDDLKSEEVYLNSVILASSPINFLSE